MFVVSDQRLTGLIAPITLPPIIRPRGSGLVLAAVFFPLTVYKRNLSQAKRCAQYRGFPCRALGPHAVEDNAKRESNPRHAPVRSPVTVSAFRPQQVDWQPKLVERLVARLANLRQGSGCQNRRPHRQQTVPAGPHSSGLVHAVRSELLAPDVYPGDW